MIDVSVQLLSIRRLPGTKQLSPDGITCGAMADDAHLNVTLEKADWPERVLLTVPLRHLRRGDQDVSLAAERLGYVSLAVHVPGGPIGNGLHAAEEEARKKEAAETARREAEEKVAREAAEAKRAAAERGQREAEEKAKVEADAAEAEAARKRREAEEKARREAEEMARRETEEAERREAERKLLEEQERVRRVREADERAAREAAEREQREAERVRREAEEKAREEAERLRREEAEEKARRDAEAKAEEEEKARQLEAAPMQKTSSEAELLELVGEKTDDAAEEAAEEADKEEAEEEEGEEEEGEEEGEEEEDDDEEEGGEEGDAGPLAELEGDSQLGCTMSVAVPEENLPATMSETLSFEWHRSADGESWEPIDGSDGARFLVTADEVGCWLFAKWMVLDGAGAVLREGSTEMSGSYAALRRLAPPSLSLSLSPGDSQTRRPAATLPLCHSQPATTCRDPRLPFPSAPRPHNRPVRLLPEDREDLKAVVLKGELLTELKSPEGRATLTVSPDGVRLSHRFGGNEVVPLDANVLRADRSDPTALRLLRPADAEKAAAAADGADGGTGTAAGAGVGVRCVCDAPQQRDLLVLAAKAFAAMGGEPQHEGACQVWEGEEYADYYGVLHAQVRAVPPSAAYAQPPGCMHARAHASSGACRPPWGRRRVFGACAGGAAVRFGRGADRGRQAERGAHPPRLHRRGHRGDRGGARQLRALDLRRRR